MGFWTYIVVGLIAGFLLKLVLPSTRDEAFGVLGTLLLGVVGAVIGGWTWSLLLHGEGATAVDAPSIFVAFAGSCIVIGLLKLFTKSNTVTY